MNEKFVANVTNFECQNESRKPITTHDAVEKRTGVLNRRFWVCLKLNGI